MSPSEPTLTPAAALTAGPPQGGVMPWLRLLRLPTVFTALADILCGYLLTQQTSLRDLPGQSTLWLLLGASAGLYLSGMVLNDVFDVAEDRRERPERPIPAGQIRCRAAAGFGGILLVGGLICAAFAGGPSLGVAALIAIAILAYDGGLKATPAGPLLMGGCRGLNLLLGASAAPGALSTPAAPHVVAAAALFLYTVGVTVFARNEAGRVSRGAMRFGLSIAFVALAVDGVVVQRWADSPSSAFAGWLLLGLLALNLILRGSQAVRDPQPGRVQKTVGLLLLCIIFIDTTIVLAITGDGQLAAVVLVLVVPVSLLKRIIPLS